jgi:hypothetical protein
VDVDVGKGPRLAFYNGRRSARLANRTSAKRYELRARFALAPREAAAGTAPGL